MIAKIFRPFTPALVPRRGASIRHYDMLSRVKDHGTHADVIFKMDFVGELTKSLSLRLELNDRVDTTRPIATILPRLLNVLCDSSPKITAGVRSYAPLARPIMPSADPSTLAAA